MIEPESQTGHPTLTHINTTQALLTWLFLVAASLLTAWLGDHHGYFGLWTVAVILGVAALKARAIIMYYMEIRLAPITLRLFFEGWVAICIGGVGGFCYFG